MGGVSNRLLDLLGPRLEPCAVAPLHGRGEPPNAPARPDAVDHALLAVCAAHDAVDIADWRRPLAELAALLREHGDQPEALAVARVLVGEET